MRRLVAVAIVLIVAAVLLIVTRRQGDQKEPDMSFSSGPINAVTIQREGKRLAVYGDPSQSDQTFDHVLLTHARRDAVWPARKLQQHGAKVIAPAAEKPLLANPSKHWDDFTQARFHDYGQQSTKILTKALPVDRWVRGGDTVHWQGLDFQVLDTPGYTRGAVSYIVELDGKRVAFTGDLIYGDGQLIDLYSLQDAIPKANIRGYHGYASRLAQLIPSLRKIADANPEIIVPARGPVINNPQQAIKRLIERVQKIYRNYLSTNALNWYFKEERMLTCGKRVLGDDADIELMDYAKHQQPPSWVWGEGTSRLLISDNGHGFLLDCGRPSIIDSVNKLIEDGKIKQVDGIFATHCHDDHTDSIQAAAEAFDCPVYALTQYADVLENPGAYHLPGLTTHAIEDVKAMKDGQRLDWQEFKLTFHDYPGQMFYHGALFVEKEGETPVFFIGDSFSPSGIDDYCLLNRNLVHDDGGYLRCLREVRDLGRDYWLINEHIPFVFRFSPKELDYLEGRYKDRIALLRQLFPWDDPNYGIDEQWAVFYPYGRSVTPGQNVDLEVRLTNHSPRTRTFDVTPQLPNGMKLVTRQSQVTLKPRQSGRVHIKVKAPSKPGNYVVTADVDSDGMQFRRWVEALITVEDS